MPLKPSPRNKKSDNIPEGDGSESPETHKLLQSPHANAMAAVQPQSATVPYTLGSRPTLPPLPESQPQFGSGTANSPSFPGFPLRYGSTGGHVSPSTQIQASPYTEAFPKEGEIPLPQSMPVRSYGPGTLPSKPILNTDFGSSSRGLAHNPLKRPLEHPVIDFDRHSYGTVQKVSSQAESEDSRLSPSSTRSPVTTTTVNQPSFGNLRQYSRTHSESSSSTNAHRCSLHIRQQPRAARAGPDGKDRRSIDPPPVIQLLLNDFDPESDSDIAEMQSAFWVVHCRLVTPQSPKKDLSTLSSVGEDGSRETQRLLLGTAVASPFHCSDDPDPDTIPSHPLTKSQISRPPSPSSRFLPTSTAMEIEKGKGKASDPTRYPSTFFIFADLSVRKAGEYRLEFALMKVEANMLLSGSHLAIIHSVTSHVFRVVNAKDFDQVQPSTNLVRGLLDRGAGFPLKLKKGTREGQRSRRARSEDEEGSEDNDDDS